MITKLREPTHYVTEKIIKDMKDLVLDVIGRCQAYINQTGATGVAANQVGSNFKIICLKVGDEIINCINPTIIKASKATVRVMSQDPSFPGLTCRVVRYNKIKVKYLQADGDLKIQEKTLRADKGWTFQRCLDLLDNIIIFDVAIPNDNWKKEFPKVRRIGKDYYIEGENKLWFSELELHPFTEDHEYPVVGVKYDVVNKEPELGSESELKPRLANNG